MERLGNIEPSINIQPTVAYEDSIFSRAYVGAMHDPDHHNIIGFEAIDNHVNRLMELWRDHGDIHAYINALTIMECFPDHFGPTPNEVYNELTSGIKNRFANQKLEERDDSEQNLFMHLSQLPTAYSQITSHILEIINSRSQPLDDIISLPIVAEFLDAYAENELPQHLQGRVEALYHLLDTSRQFTLLPNA